MRNYKLKFVLINKSILPLKKKLSFIAVSNSTDPTTSRWNWAMTETPLTLNYKTPQTNFPIWNRVDTKELWFMTIRGDSSTKLILDRKISLRIFIVEVQFKGIPIVVSISAIDNRNLHSKTKKLSFFTGNVEILTMLEIWD